MEKGLSRVILKEDNMNKEFVEMFINQIEDLMRASDKEEYVQDEAGMYLKVPYLEHLISEARELIKSWRE